MIFNVAENDKVIPFDMSFDLDGVWQDMSAGWTCKMAISNEDKSVSTAAKQITATQLVDGVPWFVITMNDTEAAALVYTTSRKGFNVYWLTVEQENVALDIRKETDITLNVRKQAVN